MKPQPNAHIVGMYKQVQKRNEVNTSASHLTVLSMHLSHQKLYYTYKLLHYSRLSQQMKLPLCNEPTKIQLILQCFDHQTTMF
jgi:hypothetical protein